LGFPGDAYLLAMVGGTGVGKSSLLNALAGATVSAASVRRPTTSDAVAWVPAAEREGLSPVLDWLGVVDVREHEANDLGPVAILDLPDVDSLATEHRARVDAILPRVDAVAWVTDPEKYHDAILHDDFLRTWLPRLARQIVVVNKADRVSADDARRIRRDLEADLRRLGAAGDGRTTPVIGASAAPASAAPAAGPVAAPTGPAAPRPEIDGLRAWLAEGVAAKAVIRARIAASAREGARALSRAAGIDPTAPVTPYLEAKDRAAAIEEATAAVLRAIDLRGLGRQAEAATRARARARGTGPMGRLTSLLYRASGRDTRVADPGGYLVRWRERGPMTPAVEAIRHALAAPLRSASPTTRPALAAALEPAELRLGLERAVDRAVAGIGSLEPPSSRWWPLLGFLQMLATAGIALSVAWLVVMVLGGPSANSVQVPILGSIPTPFATLVAFLLVGYLLARLLGAHAGWVGRRWAARVGERVASAVQAEIGERGLTALDSLEDARTRLWTATSTLERTCAQG
jgi:energy-coupling factor transporter ATP-binding protein EcfA2